MLNNLRQLAAAADQHYLETGTNTATYDQLVGPTRYVKVINPVAGENYRALRFQQGQPLRVLWRDGQYRSSIREVEDGAEGGGWRRNSEMMTGDGNEETGRGRRRRLAGATNSPRECGARDQARPPTAGSSVQLDGNSQ